MYSPDKIHSWKYPSLALLAILGILLLGATQRQATPPAAITKWEYKTEIFDAVKTPANESPALVNPSTSQLNELGLQGWEVVSTYLEHGTAFPELHYTSSYKLAGVYSNVRPQRLVVILKRPLK